MPEEFQAHLSSVKEIKRHDFRRTITVESGQYSVCEQSPEYREKSVDLSGHDHNNDLANFAQMPDLSSVELIMRRIRRK